MAKFTMTIEADNEAFIVNLEGELARILRRLANEIEQSHPDWTRRLLRDHSGNIVGDAKYEE